MDRSGKDKLRIIVIGTLGILVVLTLSVFAIPIFLGGRLFEGGIAIRRSSTSNCLHCCLFEEEV